VNEKENPLKKVYRLERQKVLFGIWIPAILAAMITIWMLVDWLGGNVNAFTIPIAALSGLIFLDHVLSLSHPETVTIDDSSIELSGFGRHHRYALDEIRRINVRKNAYSKSLYVRINEAGLLKGRYWLQIDKISDGQELQKVLESLVEQKHPMMKHLNQRSFTKTK